MSSGQWGTHGIEMSADRVIKRFASRTDGRAEREWRGLTLLAAHAPGLAPEPWEADLAVDRPVVVMSRLEGVPLHGTAMGEKELEAFTGAVDSLHRAVPIDVVRRVPLRPGRPSQLIGLLDRWAVDIPAQAGGLVRQALDAGLGWLPMSGLASDTWQEVPEVFGPGDGNLANYLWEGSRVQVVDFEDSGRSDSAFELAEITEHVGSWVEHPLDVSAFLDRFDLTAVETARLRECRRLLALVWLFLLARDDPERPRNPAGTVEKQAARLLGLLG
ncbi:phosphotransferase [Streptomyces cinnabarinus]|uniref:Phosphotransferase n=1 Tax=Streptomyces cinnabarinus TaxID=67287 RepID=A0ABY7K637_9ACTN|nr:phosphotransferase [Streptomyces cinnabarinus]WAZ19070.1 phosphotransferase [Streptomyces cinnabarinus]